ncbi:hypothetical protein D3C77_562720 [compost metagenome]
MLLAWFISLNKSMYNCGNSRVDVSTLVAGITPAPVTDCSPHLVTKYSTNFLASSLTLEFSPTNRPTPGPPTQLLISPFPPSTVGNLKKPTLLRNSSGISSFVVKLGRSHEPIMYIAAFSFKNSDFASSFDKPLKPLTNALLSTNA